ncbi:unnamed protein product [Cyprideis torosa]|uniref:Pre-mRNA-splicing factor SLU7 n=1 Tax=Cyprideis torosa TaxID=163714 RepID=A0A7R8WBB3_9CRUS|nr:unnamed protein product [Cyprideis torosa]CAG0891963.1 unnamed protein product [Cyprideis torosa]
MAEPLDEGISKTFTLARIRCHIGKSKVEGELFPEFCEEHPMPYFTSEIVDLGEAGPLPLQEEEEEEDDDEAMNEIISWWVDDFVKDVVTDDLTTLAAGVIEEGKYKKGKESVIASYIEEEIMLPIIQEESRAVAWDTLEYYARKLDLEKIDDLDPKLEAEIHSYARGEKPSTKLHFLSWDIFIPYLQTASKGKEFTNNLSMLSAQESIIGEAVSGAMTSSAMSTIDNLTKGIDEKEKMSVPPRQALLFNESQAGTAPAEVDEEGRDINPHIPQYISTAPWYFGSSGPTLKHQRPQPEKQKQTARIDEWYQRGVKGKVATKFRPGACENCGAMTHKRKDCMERPRKTGARFTGTNLAADEVVQPDLKLDFEGKRDRWAGFDPAAYQSVIEDHAKMEELRREIKASKLKQDMLEGKADVEDADSEDEEDEDKYADKIDMPGTKVDSKQRITVRNLRIREDTAKYLRNLDPNSAYYDPKTRSMRDNPYKILGKSADEVDFAGDNFVRYTGDTKEHARTQMFAWEAQSRGVDVHSLADPTKLELLKKEYKNKKEEIKSEIKGSILEKYGGEEHLKVPPKELIFAQSENYVEYSREGKIIKGAETEKIRSKYEEDVLTNNHTAVWGSYWEGGKWGYKCCHSFIRNSYCTGRTGKGAELKAGDDKTANSSCEKKTEGEGMKAVSESEAVDEAAVDESEERREIRRLKERLRKRLAKAERQKARAERRKKGEEDVTSSSSEDEEQSEGSSSSSSSSSSSDSSDEEEEVKVKEKEERLKKALLAEERNAEQAEVASDDRKRSYHSRYEAKAPTEEEMEAFYIKRKRDDDPMANWS